MKAHRAEDRPYERCLAAGPVSLTDAELIAVILRTGTTGRNAVDLADSVLNLNRVRPGLSGLSNLTMAELTAVPGIGRVKAIQLMCLAELSRRMARRSAAERMMLDSPASVAAYYMEDLRAKEQECLCLVMLDTRCRLIADRIITVGTVNQSLVSAREIFIEALRHKAVSIILLHNHPSGDPTPSADDHAVTAKLCKAGELVGIVLADHIIIGDGRYLSFREEGFIKSGSYQYGQ